MRYVIFVFLVFMNLWELANIIHVAGGGGMVMAFAATGDAQDPRVHRLLQGRPSREHQCNADSGGGRDAAPVRRDVLDRDRLSESEAYLRQHRQEHRCPSKGTHDGARKADGQQVVRSDWLKVGDADSSPEAHQQLEKLPADFETGENYIEYVFPA